MKRLMDTTQPEHRFQGRPTGDTAEERLRRRNAAADAEILEDDDDDVEGESLSPGDCPASRSTPKARGLAAGHELAAAGT